MFIYSVSSFFPNYPVTSVRSTNSVNARSTDVSETKPANNPDAGKPTSPSGDILDISDTAKVVAVSDKAKVSDTSADVKTATEETGKVASPGKPLTDEEQAQVEKLRARDAEVRAHEAAHLAAAGAFAKSGATYTYKTGPDGKKYAVGGEVSIDLSEVRGDPEATVQKMHVIRAAALAPDSPSSQDLKVAAVAEQKAAKAQAEITSQQMNGLQTGNVASNATFAVSDSFEASKSAKDGATDIQSQTYSVKRETDKPTATPHSVSETAAEFARSFAASRYSSQNNQNQAVTPQVSRLAIFA